MPKFVNPVEDRCMNPSIEKLLCSFDTAHAMVENNPVINKAYKGGLPPVMSTVTTPLRRGVETPVVHL